MKKILIFVIGITAVSFCFAKTLTSTTKVWPTIDNINATEECQISARVMPGTIRSNVTRIAKQHGWHKVVWQSPKNYLVANKAVITAADINSLMAKLLEGYPLQAVFYEGNHVLVIKPRTLQ